MDSKAGTEGSELNTSINLTLDESSVNISGLLSDSTNSILDPEQSFTRQQDLYGSIRPSPMKSEKKAVDLPKLSGKLVLPKQRKRSNSMDARSEKPGNKTRDLKMRQIQRPSTCGKENLRNFSTPLPLKVDSLHDTPFPTLTPDTPQYVDLVNNNDNDNNNPSLNSIEQTPPISNSKVTSPISVRCFSTPLADIRSGSTVKTAVQIKLHQLSSDKYLEEQERQLQREILKYQSEINLMKKLKNYRETNDTEKLDRLIDKWRDIAAKGSNYLYNEAKLKISRMGGLEEFRKKQKKTKLRKMKFEYDESLLYRIEEYMESEEYKNLDSYEKEEVISRKKEIEEMSEKIENGDFLSDDNDDDEEDEFTMKELYKQLGLDYSLVYEP
ncbi:hypothetical protein PMKS-000765 [Pichia membranifaciens]|uniref:Meiosis protein 5 n=1 Tax=Pichia membranifaciens TaxID=4926 RepID=A0A1Q2YCS1_9ASCO|nr:hypothetical protein PMKS-000765 [Pichia membranifaciens]